MEAIEFKSKVENGKITIPEHYRDKIKSNVRVIIMSEDMDRPKREKRAFSAIKLNTKDFSFDRDEANER